MGRVHDSGEVAGVLDQHVLKATSGPNQGNPPFTGGPHDIEHSLRVSVGTPWPDHDGRPGIGDQAVVYGVGGYRANLDVSGVKPGSMLQRSHGGGVVLPLGREV